MIETTDKTILHIEEFRSPEDTALVQSKLSGINGIRQVHCAPATHSVTITHDPVRAPVELILGHTGCRRQAACAPAAETLGGMGNAEDTMSDCGHAHEFMKELKPAAD